MTDEQRSTEMGTETTLTVEPDSQTIEIARTFEASRQRVFEVYTDPELIPEWWGPRNYSTSVDEMDVRPGGIWRFLNYDGDGNEYGFHGVYHDIVEPERIVQTFEFEGTPGRVQLETATFDEQDGKTRLTAQSVFQSIEDRDAMLESGMEDGARETWERFAELLGSIEGATTR
ncbi:SRPBCC family protein [Haloprofundus salinisoli]|uniref:SRPBCC family protein n=1 Tax=Haloprofundus salinisoli TaxID=2876193 RepID=UPI001CCA3499|nr:SRPBCC family protein [Haloprofundus salinisoli]